MAAYFCPDCDESYPKLPAFDDCPVCGTSTLFKGSLLPAIDEDEGLRRKAHREKIAEFEAWCEANGRTLNDVPPEPEVFLPRGATRRDKLTAYAVRDALLRHPQLHPVSELHVFLRGL